MSETPCAGHTALLALMQWLQRRRHASNLAVSLEVIDHLKDAMDVAVPELPLDPLEVGEEPGALSLRARHGAMRAAMAALHKIPIAAFHMLLRHTGFRELGEAFLDQRARHRVPRQLVRRLGNLGDGVILQPTREHPATT